MKSNRFSLRWERIYDWQLSVIDSADDFRNRSEVNIILSPCICLLLIVCGYILAVLGYRLAVCG